MPRAAREAGKGTREAGKGTEALGWGQAAAESGSVAGGGGPRRSRAAWKGRAKRDTSVQRRPENPSLVLGHPGGMGGAPSEDNKLWNEGVGCCSSLPPSFHMHDDTISLHLSGFLGFFFFFIFFLFSQKLYFEDNQKENVFWVWLHAIYPIAKVGGRRRGKTERLLLKGVEAEGCSK